MLPKICYLVIRIILSHRHLKNTKCEKGTLTFPGLPESRR